ncbi:hypothetical protein ACIRPT_38495 [Streptomyces sp. NPDC101227]|uniref:hypothetical protein n=1 Tax=Streptomyces sp. NPDC101227 TaxID=3366136 RepID=UPI0038064AE7
MARIRTIKPEAFTSESLAEVSVHAERTFFGLLTQADDHGRFRDNPAVIAGLLWPLRAEHTAVHVEEDLQQLADAGLICRYLGCDGRRYLHIVTWFEHQKIDKPSQTRIPACSDHHAKERCGSCKGTCSVFTEGQTNTHRGLPETSAKAPRTLDRPSKTAVTPPAARSSSTSGQQATLDGTIDASKRIAKKTTGQKPARADSPKAPRNLPEGSAPGSRILDPGSSNPSGRTAPAPSPSAQDLLGEYVAACTQRPPGDVIGHLGRITRKLLDEGIAPEHIRSGLQRFAANPKHPSVLTSMVNEAMNASPAGLVRLESRPNLPGHRAWANPADPAAAYAEEL